MVSALAEEVGHLEFSALMPGRGIRCIPQLSSLIMPVLYGRSKTVPQGWRKTLAVDVQTEVGMVKVLFEQLSQWYRDMVKSWLILHNFMVMPMGKINFYCWLLWTPLHCAYLCLSVFCGEAEFLLGAVSKVVKYFQYDLLYLSTLE